MNELVTEIKSINQSSAITKHESIVKGVTLCIQEDALNLGDTLPSVNELSSDLGFARETIVKAYKELKEKGIIESKPGVGYFISNNDTELTQNIALVLYGFQIFQQEFYNAFRKALGDKFKVDVYFHHNNMQIYESILNSIAGKYGMYVVAPIQAPGADVLLSSFNAKRLLIIDRYQFVADNVSKITQEFEQSLLCVFEDLKHKIEEYDNIILYYHDHSDYPKEIFEAVKQFVIRHNLNLEVFEEYDSSHLKNGNLFFTVGDSDLWQIIKEAKDKNYRIGEDIGILSHNDSPVKSIVEGGITTFSTDFKVMGEMAADFIIQRKYTNTIIPSKLIKRKSL